MKPPEYYAATRDDITRFVPAGVRRLLDVGCGFGYLGASLKRSRGAALEVVGIETDAGAAGTARSTLDAVIVGDVEDVQLPFPPGHFDCIIYGDVLEHLVDPWGLMKSHVRYLSDDGHVIASIPNVAHYRTFKMLRGRQWRYADRGLMDRTHLRYFALGSIEELFGEAGLVIVSVEKKLSGSKVKKTLNRMLFGLLDDLLTEQYIVVGRKRGPGEGLPQAAYSVTRQGR